MLNLLHIDAYFVDCLKDTSEDHIRQHITANNISIRKLILLVLLLCYLLVFIIQDMNFEGTGLNLFWIVISRKGLWCWKPHVEFC